MYKVFSCLLCLVLILSFTCCTASKDNKAPVLPDFTASEISVLRDDDNYKFSVNLLNDDLPYDLILEYCGGGKVFSGLKYHLSGTNCSIVTDSGIKEYALSSFPETFIPRIIYHFICETDFSSLSYDFNPADGLYNSSFSINSVFIEFRYRPASDSDLQELLITVT